MRKVWDMWGSTAILLFITLLALCVIAAWISIASGHEFGSQLFGWLQFWAVFIWLAFVVPFVVIFGDDVDG